MTFHFQELGRNQISVKGHDGNNVRVTNAQVKECIKVTLDWVLNQPSENVPKKEGTTKPHPIKCAIKAAHHLDGSYKNKHLKPEWRAMIFASDLRGGKKLIKEDDDEVDQRREVEMKKMREERRRHSFLYNTVGFLDDRADIERLEVNGGDDKRASTKRKRNSDVWTNAVTRVSSLPKDGLGLGLYHRSLYILDGFSDESRANAEEIRHQATPALKRQKTVEALKAIQKELSKKPKIPIHNFPPIKGEFPETLPPEYPPLPQPTFGKLT